MSSKRQRTQNRNVLITGAASGIGYELALDFYLRENCNVVLIDRDYQGLLKLKKELNSYHLKQRCHVYKCDIGSSSSLKQLQAKLKNKKMDILINNAGLFYSGSFEKMQIKDFEKIVNVDLLGTVRLTRMILPQLLKSEYGSIVNMASLAGLVGAPGMCAYAAAKFGVVGFSQSLAAELKGRVNVSVVCPSFVKTKLAENTILEGLQETNRDEVIDAMDRILAKFGSSPHKVSAEVIKAIQNQKTQVLINAEAFFFYYLHKFLPQTSGVLINQLYKWLIKVGALHV